MGIDDPARQGFVEHRVTTDVAGEVTAWLRDLETAWAAEQDRSRVLIEGKAMEQAYAMETIAPPQVTWEYLTSPLRRPQWNADAVVEQSPSGRRGAGTVNHCIHGPDAIVEEILDYRPFDYVTTRAKVPAPGAPKLTYSQVLTPLPDGGTRVEFRLARPRPRDRAIFDQMLPMVAGMIDHGFATIAPLLEAEARSRGAGDDTPLPERRGRFASEPVTA